LPAHVALLLDEFLEAELHREAPIVLGVNYKHWLHKYNSSCVVDVVFGALLLLLVRRFGPSSVVALVRLRRAAVHVDADFDRAIIIS